jgi:hypothetical protein
MRCHCRIFQVDQKQKENEEASWWRKSDTFIREG